MVGIRSKRRERTVNYWPGFVDALSTLLLAIIFLLSVFMISQYILGQEITGKDAVLNRLNSQINELTSLLALERSNKQDLENELINLRSSFLEGEEQRSRLQNLLQLQSGQSGETEEKITNLANSLDEEKKISKGALSQVKLLNQQILALRLQIKGLEDALAVSEERDRNNQSRIVDLGKRLNVALAQKVLELKRYRSDFFGRLREILGKRSDIQIVGDRFVFQSEVLFNSGSDALNPEGSIEIEKLASAILELEKEIPKDIKWILRVDGHTDNRPINSERFRSNWELSASRAISVVQYLISKKVKPNRLVAAGFGEFHPLDRTDSDSARARNRRIELKLTEQ